MATPTTTTTMMTTGTSEVEDQNKRLSQDLDAKLDVFLNKLQKSSESIDSSAEQATIASSSTTSSVSSSTDVGQHAHPQHQLVVTKDEQKELAAVLVKTGLFPFSTLIYFDVLMRICFSASHHRGCACDNRVTVDQ